MSTEGESLSEILQGSFSSAPSAKAEPATDVKPEPVKAPEPAAPSAAKAEPEVEAPKAAQARDESGKFAKAEPKADKKPEPMVPLSALLAERAKRREPEAPKAKTSFLENEEQAFQERATDALSPIKEQLFEMSVEHARDRYSDFDEVAEVFAKAANNDERLWQQMRESRNPAKYVYQVGKQFAELAPFGGDLLKYREHITATEKAELTKANERIAALAAEVETLKSSKAALDAVPRSLNSSPSATATAAETDDESIQSIARFGNRKT